MAKVIKYIRCVSINHGTEETPDWLESFRPVEMGWNEANEAIAQKEAYNGEYTIEDDGTEQVIEPSASEILDALLGA